MPYAHMPPSNQPSHSNAIVTGLPQLCTAAGTSTALEKNASIADSADSSTKPISPQPGWAAIHGAAAVSNRCSTA